MTPEDLTPEELHELLGAYAIGALDDDEREQVDRYLLDDPTARADLHELQLGASWLDHAAGRAPAQVWDRIAAELHDARPAEPEATVTDLASRRRPRTTRLLAVAAAVVVALVAVIGVFALTDSGGGGSSDDLTVAAAAARRNPDAEKVPLQGDDGTVWANVVMLPDGTAYFTNSNLAPAGKGRVYQLWTITDDGAKSAGVLGEDPSVHRFEMGDGVTGVAVTRENAPGVRSSKNIPVATGAVV